MEKELKIAIFNDCYGTHPFGGPAIRMTQIARMLREHNIFFKIFGNNSNIHPDYEVEGAKGTIFNKDDFNIFWSEQGFNHITTLNQQGILPIIGSNHVPNSAPMHCLPYLDEVGNSRQPNYNVMECKWVSQFKGKFWLSQSDFQEREYRRLGLSYDIPVYRANNPVDIRKFFPAKEKPKDKFVIGWTGKNNWAKHPIFLKAIAEKLPEIEFRYFSDETRQLNLGINVKHVIGNTNKQMPDMLRQCNMFISTSVTENQPLGVLEAMSTGLPVLVFRTSGMPEVVEHNVTGKLIDLGNIDHFVVEIKRLLRSSEEQERLGKNGRDYIIKNFSFDACILQYKTIFKKYLEVSA